LEPVGPDFFGGFRFDLCDACGECLTHCPVMDLPLEMAKNEMRSMIDGNPTDRLLSDCQSCFTCNFYCEKECNPASLVLQRWNEQYQREGLRIRAKYYMTLHPNYPNFRSYAVERMTPEEREIIARWRNEEPLKGDTLTYPGCNVILTPTLVQSELFKDLDIRGRLEYCCGETLFRTGFVDEVRRVAKRLNNWFNRLKPKHLLVLCTAGTNVFRNVLPNHGLDYEFESVTSYLDWLWSCFDSGDIQVKNQLDLTVTIQDSCYSKMFGDDYMDIPRNILETIGCDVVEMPYNRENMRCCGIGAGFSVDSAYHAFKMRGATSTNLDHARATGADVYCVYCSGCLQTFYSAKKLYFKPFRMEILHLIELVQLAIGEVPKRMIGRTSSKTFRGLMRQLPKQWSRKTFRLPDIPDEPERDAY